MRKVLLFLAVILIGFHVSAQDSTASKKMWAKSLLNQKAPKVEVEWITEKPDTAGKFVLMDFWTTGCAPCRKAIPELNAWSKKFKKNLVIIGVALQPVGQVKPVVKELGVEYSSAADPKGIWKKELGITGVPHLILIDPKGIVRWEGFPFLKGYELTADSIQAIIEKYKSSK